MNTCGRLQRLFRDIRIARQHDDGSVRVDPFHFNCSLLPIHLRHNIINDYNINRMDGRQFQAFSAAGCGPNGIPKAFEECLFAFQQILVIVDNRRYRELSCFGILRERRLCLAGSPIAVSML